VGLVKKFSARGEVWCGVTETVTDMASLVGVCAVDILYCSVSVIGDVW
jgi:hypothetical protein